MGAGIGSFVALGDSFTEGMGDPSDDGTSLRGWADRFAERLAAGQPAFRYANLAVRGKRLREVAAEQIPQAIALRPDLVSIFAGGNDLLWIRTDPDVLAQQFDDVVVQLRGAGCQVLAFTGFDPSAFPVLRLIRGKVAAFNVHLRAIASRRGCQLADLWPMSMLTDPREWSPDRLHLAADGHRRVALLASEVIGAEVSEDWREPLPAQPAAGPWLSRSATWLTARGNDARWAREHATPWLVRRLRGVSAGDGIPPKRPRLLPLTGAGTGAGTLARAGTLAGSGTLAGAGTLAGSGAGTLAGAGSLAGTGAGTGAGTLAGAGATAGLARPGDGPGRGGDGSGGAAGGPGGGGGGLIRALQAG